jgi:hypothetical protein
LENIFFGLQFLNPSEVGDSFAFDLVESLVYDDRVQNYLVENYISEDALFLPYMGCQGCTMVKKKITLHSKNLKKLPALTNNSSLI